MSRKKKWSLIGALCVVAVMLIVMSVTALVTKRSEQSVVLQRLTGPNDDAKECFELVARCKTASTFRFDFENHTISDISFSVIYRTIKGRSVIFKRDVPGSFSLLSSAPAPLWGTDFVHKDVVLPSGRLFRANKAQIGLVMFDGRKCQLFILDKAVAWWQAAIEPTDAAEYQAQLKELWQKFPLEDVYWCAALITCAEFFLPDVKGSALSFQRSFTDIESLHDKWAEMRAQVNTAP